MVILVDTNVIIDFLTTREPYFDASSKVIAKCALERMGSKTHIYSQNVRKAGEHTVSSLELVSHTITDSVYNIMFFSSLKRKVLIGFINFNYKFFNRYHCIAEEMLQSFRFAKEE